MAGRQLRRQRRRVCVSPWEHVLDGGPCWCMPRVSEGEGWTLTVHRDPLEVMLVACVGAEAPRVFVVDENALEVQ